MTEFVQLVCVSFSTEKSKENVQRHQLKQPNRNQAEKVVSVRFQTKSGMVHLMCEYDPTSIRPNCRKHRTF